MIASQTKSNEWYTPSKYIEAAREVMGSIDLDPASCELANQTVKASRYYTKEDDGLEQSWYCNSMWLNPPYGRTLEMKAKHQSTIDLFVSRLVAEYEQGNVHQAILLVPATIGTHWFSLLWRYSICFHTGKIKFIAPVKHTTYSHAYGTCLIYLGKNEQKFIEVFSQFGTIAKRVSAPK